MEPEELRELFVSRNSMTRGSLAGAQWIWEGNRLIVRLLGNGKKELEEQIPAVQTALRERFAAPVDIRIEAGKDLGKEELFQALEQMRAAALDQFPTAAAVQKPQKQEPEQSEAILGKPFKGCHEGPGPGSWLCDC